MAAMTRPVPAAVRNARPSITAHRAAKQRCIQVVRCQAAQVQEMVTESSGVAWTPGKVAYFSAEHHDDLMAMSSQRLVVVDVFTTWCGPCKLIAPELEKIAEEHGERLVMSKIDCTTSPENKKWAMANNVKALPTFILFRDGKRVNDMTGAKAANLRKLIEAHI